MLRLKKKIGHVLVAMVAATSLYTASFTAIAPHVANAEAENGENTEEASPEDTATLEFVNAPNIEPDRSVSLVITKYGGSDCNVKGNPENTDGKIYTGTINANCSVLSGVKFKITKVKYNGEAIDLGTPAGWKTLNDDKPTVAKLTATGTKYSLESTGSEVETGDDGAVTFSGEGVSKTLYYVEEVDPGSSNNVTKRVDPFLVTLPLLSIDSQADDGKKATWTYDVHVYPKNNKGGKPEKSISTVSTQSLKNSGSTTTSNSTDGTSITWKVSAPVTAKTAGKANFITGKLEDTLAATLTCNATPTVLNASAKLTAAGDKAEQVIALGTATCEGQKLTIPVAAGATGLNLLEEGRTIEFTFTTPIKLEAVTGPTNIDNRVSVIFDGNTNACPDTDTTCRARAVFGQLQITKNSTSDTAARLKDAEFQVIDAPGSDNAARLNACKAENHKVLDTIKTGADGIAKSIILISTDGSTTSRWVCLKESKFPTGYVLPDSAQNDGYTLLEVSTSDTAATTDVKQVTISNTPVDLIKGLTLPLTGAAGQLTLLILAIASASLGGVFIIISRRRKQNKL